MSGRRRKRAPRQPIAVIAELCQCTSAALVKLLTPDEIARNLQPGIALSDEQVQRAVDQCPDAIRKVQRRWTRVESTAGAAGRPLEACNPRPARRAMKPKADKIRWTLVLTERRSLTEPLVVTKAIRFPTKRSSWRR